MRTLASSEVRRRRTACFWHSVNQLIISCIVIGLGALAVLAFLPEMRRLTDLGANLASTQRQVAEEELSEMKLQRQLNLIENDPAYVESLARDRLGVMKEGETIFRLDTVRQKEAQNPR